MLLERWLALGSLCSLVIACSGDEAPPLVKARPDGGGARPGIGGTIGAGGEGTSGSGGSSAGPGTSAEITPEEIYLSGTLVEGNSSAGAVANVTDPNVAILGFSGRFDGMSVKFLGRDLVYRELVTDAVFRFVPDRLSSAPYSFDTYPRMAESNDEPLSIAPCSDSGNRLVRYMTGPDEKFVVECLDGYYEDGAPLDTGGNILYALGYNQLALASGGILDLSDGSVRPHAAGGAFVAARAYEGGFYAAFGPVSEPMLWDVSASGDAVHLGDYPPLDGVHLSDTSRLGPDQALYDLISGEQEEVVRRTADGDREIIYSETTDPLVRAVPFSSTVVTGP